MSIKRLWRAHLKLLRGLLINVWRAKHCPTVDGRRKRIGPATSAPVRFAVSTHLPRGLVQDAVIKSFQTNSNFVALSHVFFF